MGSRPVLNVGICNANVITNMLCFQKGDRKITLDSEIMTFNLLPFEAKFID